MQANLLVCCLVGFAKSMGQADEDENCKVVAICPGMVATPLWTGDSAKHVHAQFSYTEDMCITADEVAEGMKDLVEQGKYGGGTLLEVKKGALRNVLESKQAIVVEGQRSEDMKPFFDTMYAPLREVFSKERGVATSTNGA